MICKGDIICFKDAEGGGEVLAVYLDQRALVLRDDGFEQVFPISELLVPQVSEEEMAHLMLNANFEAIIEQKEGKKKSKTDPKLVTKYHEPYEVDLHIEAIMERFKHLSNGEILQIQIGHARSKLEYGLMNKQSKLVFIHGVGQGVLRDELYKMLCEYPGIKHFDASYRKYGFGATEVNLI
jgi:hypothetical protein